MELIKHSKLRNGFDSSIKRGVMKGVEICIVVKVVNIYVTTCFHVSMWILSAFEFTATVDVCPPHY